MTDGPVITDAIPVKLTGPRKRFDAAQQYVDLWTKTTGWPKDTDVISAIHFERAGHGTFELDADEARRLMSKPGVDLPWLAAVTQLSWLSTLDATEMLRLTRDCWRASRRDSAASHNDWVHLTQNAVLVLQARHQAGVGVANLTAALCEVFGMREDLADAAEALLAERLAETRRRRSRQSGRRWLS